MGLRITTWNGKCSFYFSKRISLLIEALVNGIRLVLELFEVLWLKPTASTPPDGL